MAGEGDVCCVLRYDAIEEPLVTVRAIAVLLMSILLSCATGVARAQSAPTAQPSAQARQSSSTATDDWTGLYFGANVGHASASFSGPVTFAAFTSGSQRTPAESVTFGPASAGSAAIGLQAGYGVRLASSLVGAIEVQFTHAPVAPVPQLVGAQAPATGVFIPADSLAVATGSTTSIRMRVGAPMARGVFVYGTVGVMMAPVTTTGIFPAVGSFPAAGNSQSKTMKGLTIGVGAEFVPFKSPSLRHMTIGAEFRHASLGSQTFDFGDVVVSQPPPVLEPALGTITVTANEFDVRVIYRFPMKR
jgi:opacity protein-like surface antigen